MTRSALLVGIVALALGAGQAAEAQRPARTANTAKAARGAKLAGARAAVDRARVKIESRFLGAQRAEANRVTREARRSQLALGRALRRGARAMRPLQKKAEVLGVELPALLLGKSATTNGFEVHLLASGYLRSPAYHLESTGFTKFQVDRIPLPGSKTATIGQTVKRHLPGLTPADVQKSVNAWVADAERALIGGQAPGREPL